MFPALLMAALAAAPVGMPPVVDTHIDAPSLQVREWKDLLNTTDRDFDAPAATKGGLKVGFMSIYTSPTQDEQGTANASAHQQIDAMEALAYRAPYRFVVLRSARDYDPNDKRIALTFGMENAAPIGDRLDLLKVFRDRGVSYITLAHSANNRLADSSYAVDRKWNGLSPFGKQVVDSMNRLGIMVDVSHVSDQAALQAIALSRAPVIASHSAFRHFTPGFERNVSDEIAKAIAAKGGVVQVTFGTQFVNRKDALGLRDYFIELKKFKDGVVADLAAGRKPPKTEAEFDREWDAVHPYSPATVREVADHIVYGIGLIGADHIGIGSDFDGVGEALPTDLRTVADYPKLANELRRRGISDADIAKVMGGNLLRVWRQVDQLRSE